MRFGYTIIYVDNVPDTVRFYERAFGLTLEFMDDEQRYAQLATGETKLAFVADELAASNVPEQYLRNHAGGTPPGFEVCFETDDVLAAYNRAASAGAEAVASPEEKPWGQIVAYVRDNNGVIVEIASPLDSGDNLPM